MSSLQVSSCLCCLPWKTSSLQMSVQSQRGRNQIWLWKIIQPNSLVSTVCLESQDSWLWSQPHPLLCLGAQTCLWCGARALPGPAGRQRSLAPEQTCWGRPQAHEQPAQLEVALQSLPKCGSSQKGRTREGRVAAIPCCHTQGYCSACLCTGYKPQLTPTQHSPSLQAYKKVLAANAAHAGRWLGKSSGCLILCQTFYLVPSHDCI